MDFQQIDEYQHNNSISNSSTKKNVIRVSREQIDQYFSKQSVEEFESYSTINDNDMGDNTKKRKSIIETQNPPNGMGLRLKNWLEGYFLSGMEDLFPIYFQHQVVSYHHLSFISIYIYHVDHILKGHSRSIVGKF